MEFLVEFFKESLVVIVEGFLWEFLDEVLEEMLLAFLVEFFGKSLRGHPAVNIVGIPAEIL